MTRVKLGIETMGSINIENRMLTFMSSFTLKSDQQNTIKGFNLDTGSLGIYLVSSS